MTDQEKIKRLERTLGTLITWLNRELGAAGTSTLLQMLVSEEPLRELKIEKK